VDLEAGRQKNDRKEKEIKKLHVLKELDFSLAGWRLFFGGLETLRKLESNSKPMSQTCP
jgi:hypothetical protein